MVPDNDTSWPSEFLCVVFCLKCWVGIYMCMKTLPLSFSFHFWKTYLLFSVLRIQEQASTIRQKVASIWIKQMFYSVTGSFLGVCVCVCCVLTNTAVCSHIPTRSCYWHELKVHSEQLMVIQDFTASHPWHPHLQPCLIYLNSLKKRRKKPPQIRNLGMAGRS